MMVVGPLLPTDVRSRPTKVIRPRAFSGDGATPPGNGFARVAVNVNPLFVVGVNTVGVEKPGWKRTLCETIWNGAVKIPNPPLITVFESNAYENPMRGCQLFLSAA